MSNSQPSQQRKIPQEELEKILEIHHRWASTSPHEGQSADLSEVDLVGASLPDVDLRRSNLSRTTFKKAHLPGALFNGANLKEADLSHADLLHAQFQGANLVQTNLSSANLRTAILQKSTLTDANLKDADLSEASLREANLLRTALNGANLQDADLTDSHGLHAGQLAGANVSGAKLPEEIKRFDGLVQVDELSKSAKKLFVSMLLGCLYSWLTIATTTDVRLLTNSASSPLPVIQTEIPIVGFYWVAPILLVSMYLYFHLYLQRLWEGLAVLPAVFPDGTPLDRKAYPWLLNGLVRAHFLRLRDDRPPFSRLEVAISILLAWWLVPLTLVLFWLRYLTRHDWPGTAWHVVLIVTATSCALLFQRLKTDTLRGQERKPFHWRTPFKDVRICLRVAVPLGIGLFIFSLSPGNIEGAPPMEVLNAKVGTVEFVNFQITRVGIETWVPYLFSLIGYSPFADVSEDDVSGKPANWTGEREKEKEQIASVKGAKLQKRDLRYIRAHRAFLVKADLTGANLKEADLSGANLHRARLEGASLQDANLAGANLDGTNLNKADLTGADLSIVRFRSTVLVGTKGLTQKQIDSSCMDEHIELPVGLKRPKKLHEICSIEWGRKRPRI